MNILALQGSPRRHGNTAVLLKAFLEPFETHRAHQITRLDICYQHIRPCLSCYACEKQGGCALADEMPGIYPHLANDDVVILASPIYFYSVTAQLKAVIDRCQTFWTNPNTGTRGRTGVLLLTAGAPDKNKAGQESTKALARIFFQCIGAPLTHTIVAVDTDKRPVTEQPDVLLEARETATKIAQAL